MIVSNSNYVYVVTTIAALEFQSARRIPDSKTDYILRLIEHRVSRLLFDKIVGDANISDIVNNALNDTNLLTSISHPVKTDSN